MRPVPTVSPATPPTDDGHNTLVQQAADGADTPSPPLGRTDTTREWPEAEKRRVLFLVASAGFLAPMTTVIYLPSLDEIKKDLDASSFSVTLTLAVYNVFLAICPLLWAALADSRGRRRVLVTNMAAYAVSALLCALAWDIYSLIALRGLQGIATASLITCGAGAISDVYPPQRRGMAMGIYAMSPLLGPIIGPPLGGVIAGEFGWRAVFWLLFILGSIEFVLLFALLPETLHASRVTAAVPPPWHALRILRHWDTRMIVLLLSAMFGALYGAIVLLPLELADRFSEAEIGLFFLPLGLGLMAGVLVGGRVADAFDALYGIVGRAKTIIIGVLVFVPSFVAYAIWSLESVPTLLITSFVFGFGLMFARPAGVSYVINMHPAMASGAMASLIFTQFLMASATTFTASPARDALGYTNFFLLLTGFVILLAIVVARLAFGAVPVPEPDHTAVPTADKLRNVSSVELLTKKKDEEEEEAKENGPGA